MKKFSRFAALLLALLLAMSLAACGKKTDGGDPDPAPAKEFSAGKVDGSTYTNEYFGFSVSLTEDFGWTYFTDEQIAQVTGQTADILDSDKITEAYDSGKVIMEMYAMRDDYASVNIAVEKLGKVNGALLDEEGYVDASLNSLPEQLLTAGYTDVDAAKTTVSFAGAEHYAIAVSAAVQDVPVYELLACVKVGDYVAVVTACTYGEDTTADILAAFQAL